MNSDTNCPRCGRGTRLVIHDGHMVHADPQLTPTGALSWAGYLSSYPVLIPARPSDALRYNLHTCPVGN
jgi:hypothetical protein